MRYGLALLLLAALPLAAQVSETIEVAVTSIDVVVADAKGNHLRGLTQADFEILEDGKPRQITNFSEFALSAPAQGGATGAITARTAGAAEPQNVPPRRLMIVFDANTLTPELRRRSASAAASFIDKHVRPVDKVMIAVLSQSFTPRTEWTSDRAELKKVIEALATEHIAGTDAARKLAEEEIDSLIDLAASFAGGQGAGEPPSFNELILAARRYAEQALQDSRRVASLLGSVVTQFSPLPEKKALIFIGEGLEARPGADVFQRLETLRNQSGNPSPGMQVILQRGAPAGSVLSEANQYNNTAVLQSLAENAFRKGVPIYAVNPGTNEDLGTNSRDMGDRTQEFTRFQTRGEGYQLVGNGSGGAAYLGMRAEVALGEVAADLGGYYSLGFRASGPVKRDRIVVRVKKPAAKVRVALAGGPLSPTDAVGDAVIAHHVLAPETNDLEIELETGEVRAAGEKQKVKLNVIIPIRNLRLARQGSEVTGGFDVYLSVSDGKAYFSPVNKQTHTIRWPADSLSDDDDRTLTYSIDVTIEPGTNRISVGVVDHGSNKTGFETIEL